MGDISWMNDDRTRGAVIYEVANVPGVYRIRLHRYPDNGPGVPYGWFGGKVLWGHDQDSEEAAIVIAKRWTDEGILPDVTIP